MSVNADVKVSVYCLAYNHEKYIRKALEGFVMQKTNFKYEVFVHDDASTDGTADIIREYEKKYPDLFKVIYQKENQYSQGIGILSTYILPKMSGKYLAACEGDDYWIDENKLQMEYDYLEAHPECSLVCHAFNRVSAETGKIIGVSRIAEAECDLPSEKVILHNNNTNQLATWMWKREITENRPECYKAAKTGDTALLLYAHTQGKIHYIDEVCSVYRIMTPRSWTQRVMRNKDRRIQHFHDSNTFFSMYDKITNNIYHDIIKKKIDSNTYHIAWLENNFKVARKCLKNREMPVKRRLIVWLGCLFPKTISRLKERIDSL